MSALDDRAAEIAAFGEANGWEMVVEPLHHVDGVSAAVGIGGVFGLLADDEPTTEFMFVTALYQGMGPSGRVGTLQDDRGVRVRIELDDGSGRYWFSKRAGDWKDALVDPIAWTDWAPPEPVGVEQ